MCLNFLLLFLETSQLLFLLRIAFLSRDPSNERDFSFKILELLLKSKVLRNLATRVLVLVSSTEEPTADAADPDLIALWRKVMQRADEHGHGA